MKQPSKQSMNPATLLNNPQIHSISLKETLCNRKLWKLTVYGMLIAFSFRFPAVVLPIIGAKYFDSDSSDTNSNECSSRGNATYAMWFSLSSSIGGLLGFCFESYLGRLSDAYGRKPLMYLTWFGLFIGTASMCFTNNVWFYIILFPLSSLCGLFSGMPTVLASALSDCVPPVHKTTVFALLYGCAGFISIVGSIIAALVTSFISIKAPFFAFSGVMILALLWLIFITDETLSSDLRVPLTSKEAHHKNILSPLRHIADNKVILWISLMALITSIPESGIDDMIGSYTDDILNLCHDDKKAASFNALSGVSMGCVMLVSQLILLPILAKYCNDIWLFALVLFAAMMFMMSGVIAYIFPSVYSGLFIWMCFGLSLITSPVTNGCLAKRLDEKEQGLGMGILHAMKGLTFAVAPYIFGGLYDLFHDKGILKTIPFMFGMLFVVVGAFILFGPLKRTLNQYDDEHGVNESNDVIDVRYAIQEE